MKDLIYFLRDGDEEQKTTMKQMVDDGLTIGGGRSIGCSLC